MPELTDKDKQTLQSVLNREIHKMKVKRAEISANFHLGRDCDERCKSGRRKLTERIAYLHGLKVRLGCFEGFSQQPKPKERDFGRLAQMLNEAYSQIDASIS